MVVSGRNRIINQIKNVSYRTFPPPPTATQQHVTLLGSTRLRHQAHRGTVHREKIPFMICMFLYSLGTKFLDENMKVQVFPVYFDSFYLSFGLFMFMENTPEMV